MKNRRLGRFRPSSPLTTAIVPGCLAVCCLTACGSGTSVFASFVSNPSGGGSSFALQGSSGSPSGSSFAPGNGGSSLGSSFAPGNGGSPSGSSFAPQRSSSSSSGGSAFAPGTPSAGGNLAPQGNGVQTQGYAYIASTNSQDPTSAGAIYQYAIAADGSLSPLAAPSVPTGIGPRSIIADPTGRFVYTANSGDGTIYAFAVGAGGALTPASPSSILLPATSTPAGSQPAGNFSLSLDPVGPYVYVVVSGVGSGSQPQTDIDQFSIGPNGTLTPLIPASVSVAAVASGALAIDPTGAYAYLGAAADKAGAVFQFAIGGNGSLTPLAPASVSTAGPVVGVAFAPSSTTAYVLSGCMDNSCQGSVTPYAIANTGVLGPAGAATLTGPHVNPVDLVVEGSGTAAYLLANFMGVDTNTGSIYPYTIGEAGALTPSTSSSIPLTGAAVAQSAFGPDLWVLTGPSSATGGGTSYVASYSIGSQEQLTNVGSTQIAVNEPTGMALVEVQ